MCKLVGLVFCAGIATAIADARGPVYQGIPERNVFGLRPPPAQPALTNPPAQLPKILLTGITTILWDKRALMEIELPRTNPGEPVQKLSLILTEGQREGEIEVLQIDDKTGSVKVNNAGTVMILTFEKDGAKLPASILPQPFLPPIPGQMQASLGASANTALRSFPNRNNPNHPPLPPPPLTPVNRAASDAGEIRQAANLQEPLLPAGQVPENHAAAVSQ